MSNKISLQRTKIDSKKGTVTVDVRVPGAGEIEMVGKSAKPKITVGKVTTTVSEAGSYGVTMKPSNAAKRVLKKKGKLKVSWPSHSPPTAAMPPRRRHPRRCG